MKRSKGLKGKAGQNGELALLKMGFDWLDIVFNMLVSLLRDFRVEDVYSE